MSPGATVRFRQITAAGAVGLALLALLVGVRSQLEAARLPSLPFSMSSAGGRHTLHELSPAARAAGLAARDRLLAVDGVPMSTWVRQGGPRSLPERPVALRLARPDGSVFEVELSPLAPGERNFPMERLLRLAIPLVGLIFLGTGLVVWRLRPGRPESWALLLFCSVTSALLFLPNAPLPESWVLVGIIVPMVGASSVQLFTTYPIEPAWVVRHRWLRTSVYAIAGALTAYALASPWMGRAGLLADPLVTGFAVACAAACLAIMVSDRIRHPNEAAAARSNVMILGAGFSFLPVIVLLLLHLTTGTSYPWTFALLGFFVFPVAVGYGIVRRELFDVRLAARSSAAYGAVTLAITGLFAFVITFADALVSRFHVDARSPIFSVVFLFVAILVFNPLRGRVQRWVDAFFDRDRAAYRTAVREISEAMVSMLSVKEIVDRILIAVTDTMGVERAMVLLVDQRNAALSAVATRGEWEAEAVGLTLPADHPVCRNLWMRRIELAREDFDEEPDPEQREACRDVFDTLAVELLVPILFGVDLLGVIAVARKLTGERLGPDERQLLRTLANQSSIAIENARAFDEIAKLNETLEARVEDRTRELRDTQAQLVQSEKMRSLGQLVAGVAHELNNPIGFVHANLQLLEEYVERLARGDLDPEKREKTQAAIEKLLARCREGTQRVTRIVQDLRTFSRTDHAELQEVALGDEIDRTLGLMEPRLKGGITITRDYEDIPRIRCYAGQLNQVFMNLLMNAADALEGGGAIRIHTARDGDGVKVEVEDDGPGMPPDVMSRVFDPFFTTKPVGKGTGLGLSLSHGIVERHGGSLSVRSAPGEGTTFTVRLPLEPPPELRTGVGG